LFVANLDLANLEITSTSARRRVPRWLREVGVEYDARRRLDRGALESSSPGAVSSAAGKARRRSKGGPFQGGATKAAVEKPSPAGSSSRHLGLVRCRGRRALEVPWRFDGADDRVGPNYTGQPAVTSVYS
jgi:hypothetical protein